MRTFVLGFILGLIVLPIGAFLYIRQGYAPVAVSASPLPFEKTLAGMALNARISREAPAQATVLASEENLLAGAKLYRENCAVCHGTSVEPQTAIAKGMYPPPPRLLHGEGVTGDPVGQTYWVVSNGIRLSGMPGFLGALTEQQVWQVSQFLAHADKLPASVATFMTSPLTGK